jgi:PAS domain S-box-containing protein
MNESLEQQVEARTEALRVAYDRLAREHAELEKAYGALQERQDRELAQQRVATSGVLASGMAQELNTTLNTVQLGAQRVQECASGSSDAVDVRRPVVSKSADMLATPSHTEATGVEQNKPEFSADAIDVLLVEDDERVGRSLKLLLETRDVRIVHVTSGQEGIEAFDPERFDAVVTDVFLGDMTGVDVLRFIREKDETFPVILLTGHNSIRSAVDALRLGAQDYIPKPLARIEDLITPVRKAVDHHKLLCASNVLTAELYASEVRFRSFAELLPETVFEADRDGRVTFLNMSGMERFGLTNEVLQEGFYLPHGVSAEDVERGQATFARVLAGDAVSGVEFTGRHQSGEMFPILTFATPMRHDGAVTGIRAIVVDITLQKKSERELLQYEDTLRKMASKVQVAEEKERFKLAQDLHDSVAQLLAAAKIRISLCSQRRNDSDLPHHLEKANEIVCEAIQQTRSLVFQLSPPSLYTHGLQAGLADLAEHMLPMHGLNVAFNSSEDPVCLDEASSMHVFRSVRELLINVAKHSGVRECAVTVSQDKDLVRVTVEDQGCGFDDALETRANLEGGFGLFGTRERLKTSNGSLVLESEPGKGTKATVCVPIVAG